MDRSTTLIVGGLVVLWLLTREPRATSATSKPSSTGSDPLVSFPPLGSVDLTPLFCAPWDEYGGWSDDRKVAEGARLYVARWGFSPTPEFEAAVRQRDPCARRHMDALVEAFPPFPGQTFRASELAQKAKRQDEARASKARADAQAKADCEAAVTGGLTVAGTVVGGVLGALGTFGLATPAGLAAGGGTGQATGRFISGLWC